MQSGVILPQSLHEFTVEFAPHNIETPMELAYLEVEGFQDRITLTLTGKSIGATLVPSCRSMDLGHVMVNEVNNFEVSFSFQENLGIRTQGLFWHLNYLCSERAPCQARPVLHTIERKYDCVWPLEQE